MEATPRSARGGSSFTVFQVPAAATVIPDARTPRLNHQPPSHHHHHFQQQSQQQSQLHPQQMMTSFGEWGGGGSGVAATATVTTPSAAASSSHSLNASLAALDDALYTHSGRSHRVSLSAPNRFPVVGADAASEARGGISWMRTGRVIRVKDTGESFRFPLEDDHLPTVQPTPAQYALLKKRALALAEQSVKSSHLWMENPTLSPELKKQAWKVHLEKKNCVIYRQRGSDNKHAQSRTAILRAKIESSLDELAYAINADSTDDLRAGMAHCYQEGFLDAAVLHVAETASFEDPFQFLGIKWLAFQSSVDSVYAVRDVLVLELCKTFADAKGRKVLVRVAQSVSIKELNGSERNFGFIRSQVQWVHMFRSVGLGSGAVDVSLSSTTQFTGSSTPTWLANRTVSGMHPVVLNLATCADARYIVKSRLITNKAWVPNSERPACSVCFKSFNLLRSRHHCRICAEIMCSTCTMELTVLTSKLPAALQPETGANIITSAEKFCLKCINKCRQDRRNALASLQAAAQAALELAALEASSSGSYGRSSEVFADNRRSLSDANSAPFPPGSMHHTGSSAGGDGNGNGFNYYGWGSSSSAPPPLGRKTSLVDDDARIANLSGLTQQVDGLRVRPNNSGNAFERRRQGSDASSSGYSESSSSSESRWERREKENSASGLVLLEETEDVESVQPIPTSFVKMEESIAAQQALLRNMMLEGQKMMSHQQQQQAYRSAPPLQPPLPSRPQPLALPPPPTVTSIAEVD